MTDVFKILFLCTGNSCRSPIGEAILRKRLQEKNIGNAEVLSAGTFALEGNAASPESVESVKKYGASLEGFQSQIFTEELADSVHLILVKERAHLDLIQEHFPNADDKVRLLGQFLYPDGLEEIPDPVGGTQELFDEVAELIEECIFNLLKEWDHLVERYFNPKKKTVAIAVDHRAFSQKVWLIDMLQSAGTRVLDCGTMSAESCDHPDYAFKACEQVSWRRADRAIVMCSTGHGMLLSANKVLGVRCVMPLNEEHVNLSRMHNNSNALAFGTDYHSKEQIEKIVRVWLDTEFLGGRYHRRIRKIDRYERRNL